jgi:hypothetical protein
MVKVYFPLHFNAQGQFQYPQEREALYTELLATASPITDLWIFSHGWNTNKESADQTYHLWTTRMQECIQRNIHDTSYHPAFVGIYWPSMVYPDGITIKKNAIRISPYIDHTNESDYDDQDFYEDEIEIVNADYGERELGDDKASEEEKQRFIEVCGSFIDAHDANALQDIAHLYEILAQGQNLTTNDIENFVQILDRYKIIDPQQDISGVYSLLNTPKEVVSVLQNELTNELLSSDNPLLKAFRAFTFWTMKGRAAIVGQNGVAPFLQEVKEVSRQHQRVIRLHLFGHSFGAKLVSASIYTLAERMPKETPLVDTLILLLGAFSQFSFSSNIPHSRQTGRYATLVERHLVTNPIASIYSQYDLANKEAYPWGMFLSLTGSQNLYELGGSDDRWGSLGANGAQGLDPAICREIKLLPFNIPYNREQLTNVSWLNVDGQDYINANQNQRWIGAHGDIEHPEIFHLALAISNH